MKPLRVAMIGSGYIAHYHARGLLKQPDVEIAVVCGLEPDIARQFAEKYGIAEISDNAWDLAGRDEIHAAVLGTPNKYHAPHAIAFLEHGKDVFIEKPMATSAAEGRQVAAAARKNERLVMVGHMWRFDVDVNHIRNVVQSGQIGRVVKAKGYGIHENWGPSGWFTQKDLAGGGALADMGVHAVDTMRYLLGDPKPTQVYARMGTYYGDYDVDDTGVVMIAWDNGATGVIESGWWQPYADGPEAATRLFGTKGYASVFPTEIQWWEGEERREAVPSLSRREEHCDQRMYDRQMAHFVECIGTRTEPVAGLAEGQAVLDIVDAAYESARTGRAVQL